MVLGRWLMWETKIETWSYLNLSIYCVKDIGLFKSPLQMWFSHVCSTFLIFPNSYIRFFCNGTCWETIDTYLLCAWDKFFSRCNWSFLCVCNYVRFLCEGMGLYIRIICNCQLVNSLYTLIIREMLLIDWKVWQVGWWNDGTRFGSSFEQNRRYLAHMYWGSLALHFFDCLWSTLIAFLYCSLSTCFTRAILLVFLVAMEI